jgi:nucleoside-diphosphate-sugar epimerase
MRIFLTGATGFIGSALVPELINTGHQVLGLSRSDAGAHALAAAGAEVHRGDLENLDSLRTGAARADAVIHCGFVHDFSRFQEVCAVDARAIEALGKALAGSKRPLLITSGTGMGMHTPGQPATEDHFDLKHPNPRTASELAGASVAAAGIDVRVVRLPQVHDPVKQGLISYLVTLAREKGISAYVGEGSARWPAVHRLACAQLYRLALERGTAGTRYHAVDEEGVSMREVAECIGRSLKVPVVSKPLAQAGEHFGWLAMFAGLDMPASSALTQQRLGWRPSGPGLLADLGQMRH